MNRGSTRLALILVAALAALAVAASAASAEGKAKFQLGAEKIKVTGIHEGTEEFTFQYGTIKCSIGEYEGKAESATFEIEEIPMTPTYSECSLGMMSVEFMREGCTWIFAAGVTEGANFEGEVDTQCAVNTEHMVFVVKAGAETRCTIRIPEQQGLKSVTYTIKEDANKIKDLTADLSLTGMAYTQTAGVGLTKCAGASKADGKWTAHPTIRGLNEEGVTVPFFIK